MTEEYKKLVDEKGDVKDDDAKERASHQRVDVINIIIMYIPGCRNTGVWLSML